MESTICVNYFPVFLSLVVLGAYRCRYPTASSGGMKYDINLDSYSSHSQILAMLRELPRGSSVLDVGAAQGYIGERLSGSGFYLAGIERDPHSAAISSPYYDEFLAADIETANLCFSRKFDAIVLADVLEHVRHPLGLLVELRKYLSENGRFIISVPNVANIYVRLNLLFGKFDYADRGILDESHLRFFTLKTIQGLLQQAHLDRLGLSVTPVPLPLVFPNTREGGRGHFLHRANWLAARAWKRLFAYQFILLAAPPRGKSGV